MATLKFTKESYDYILKSERPGYYERLIKETEKDLASPPAELVGTDREEWIDDKQGELDELKKLAVKEKEALDKNGPTVWQIHSLSKKIIFKIRAAHRVDIKIPRKHRKVQDQTVGSDVLGYSNLVALEVCQQGIDGWKNLKAPDGTDVKFNRDIIDTLPENYLAELANEIMGVVSEEEKENL